MNRVQPLTCKDLSEIVLIHDDAFKGFFLTELGNDFLNLYYKSVMQSDNGIILGYFKDNVLIGFCAATTISNGFNKKLVIDNLFKFTIIGLKIFFTKPKAIIRLIKNFTKGDSSINDNGNYAELLSIGVSSNTQGLGVGKSMLSALEHYLASKECEKLSLTTDFENNEKALGFYKAMGYNIMYDFIAYPDRHMYRLIKDIKLKL